MPLLEMGWCRNWGQVGRGWGGDGGPHGAFGAAGTVRGPTYGALGGRMAWKKGGTRAWGRTGDPVRRLGGGGSGKVKG